VRTERPPTRRDILTEIDPNNPIGIRAASCHLDRCDVAIIQHEFGIFGDDEGSSVLDMLTGVDVPRVMVLHTALPSPNSQQARIVGSLAEEATIAVLCESAAKVPDERYSLPAEAIQVIRHGAQWPAQPVNHPPRGHERSSGRRDKLWCPRCGLSGSPQTRRSASW